MIYCIADMTVEIRARYDYVTRQCADYLAPPGAVPDFTVEIDDKTLAASQKEAPDFSIAYHESLCVYRAICKEMLAHGGFLLHAAVIEVDGRAYAFSAPSGMGKSTHIALWRRLLGGRVQIVNGDKPILRYRDGRFIAYGTPWCGKEGWQRNTSAPLEAICFLERSVENRIRRMTSAEAIDHIFHQLLRPKTATEMDATLSLTDTLLREVPIYLLGCNISEDAARLAYETLSGGKL